MPDHVCQMFVLFPGQGIVLNAVEFVVSGPLAGIQTTLVTACILTGTMSSKLKNRYTYFIDNNLIYFGHL